MYRTITIALSPGQSSAPIQLPTDVEVVGISLTGTSDLQLGFIGEGADVERTLHVTAPGSNHPEGRHFLLA